MIHFINAAVDNEQMAALRDAGILTPSVIEKINAILGLRESGTLNEFLLAGADVISPEPWLAWLVRRHGCHRFGRVLFRDDAIDLGRPGIAEESNLPYRRAASGSPMVALMRPDLFAATAKRLGGCNIYKAAATLPEIRALHLAWNRLATI